MDSLREKNHKEFIKNLQATVFTDEVNMITLSSKNDKRMQSIDSIVCKTILVCKTEEIKCNNIIKQYETD